MLTAHLSDTYHTMYNADILWILLQEGIHVITKGVESMKRRCMSYYISWRNTMGHTPSTFDHSPTTQPSWCIWSTRHIV